VRSLIEKMKYKQMFSAHGGLQIAHNRQTSWPHPSGYGVIFNEEEIASLKAIAEKLRPIYDGEIVWKERGDGLYEATVDTSIYPHGSMGGGGDIQKLIADSQGNLLSRTKIGVAPVLPCP
jgi:hypothetical protein